MNIRVSSKWHIDPSDNWWTKYPEMGNSNSSVQGDNTFWAISDLKYFFFILPSITLVLKLMLYLSGIKNVFTTQIIPVRFSTKKTWRYHFFQAALGLEKAVNQALLDLHTKASEKVKNVSR